MPVIEVRRLDRRNKKSIWLLDHAANVTSEQGEDGIIEKIFDVIGTKSRICVEVGAGNGYLSSNSWSLLQAGWGGLLIEGNTSRFSDLKKTWIDRPDLNLLNAIIDFEGDNRPDTLFARFGLPTNFDLFSLDIDGNDYYVWDSMDVYRPRVIVIEFNPTVPNHVYFIQDRDRSINQGASLAALVELGRRKGYELVAATLYNAFFVDSCEYEKFGIADNSIDSMYFNDDLQSEIFQGYDGTLIMAGCRRLVWGTLAPIDQEDIQPLPKALRRLA